MKIQKIFFITFLILFCLLECSTCFASEVIPGTNNVDEYEYFFNFKITDTNNVILVKCESTDFVVGHTANQSTGTVFYLNSVRHNFYILQDNSWVPCDITKYATINGGNLVFEPSSKLSMLYSNFDITYDNYWKNKTGSDFFLRTLQGILTRQVEEVEMSQVLKEIVYLLPLVIGLLVLAIGLRKAFYLLSKVLRSS